MGTAEVGRLWDDGKGRLTRFAFTLFAMLVVRLWVGTGREGIWVVGCHSFSVFFFSIVYNGQIGILGLLRWLPEGGPFYMKTDLWEGS
jgi:hypothetical protein